MLATQVDWRAAGLILLQHAHGGGSCACASLARTSTDTAVATAEAAAAAVLPVPPTAAPAARRGRPCSRGFAAEAGPQPPADVAAELDPSSYGASLTPAQSLCGRSHRWLCHHLVKDVVWWCAVMTACTGGNGTAGSCMSYRAIGHHKPVNRAATVGPVSCAVRHPMTHTSVMVRAMFRARFRAGSWPCWSLRFHNLTVASRRPSGPPRPAAQLGTRIGRHGGAARAGVQRQGPA